MAAVVLIKKDDNLNVSDPEQRFYAGELVCTLPSLPPAGSVEADITRFYTFTVTDKTEEEMNAFLDRYNARVEMTVFEGPDFQGLRSIHVVNENSNTSETLGGWTIEGTDLIIQEWNERYPSCGLITLGFPQYNTWDCQGTFTTGQAIEFNEVVVEEGLARTFRQRQWLVSPAGMANIAAAGGAQSGTAQQFGQIIDNRVDS